MDIFYSPHTDPCRNLALEEVLFAKLPKGSQALFLWQNGPSVVLGRFQNAAAEVDLAEAARRGIRVVRRLSGGGAVYHDLGNLNYSLVADCEEPDSAGLALFTQPAVRACRRLGVDASFGGRNDIFADGRKLSGSAQYYRDGRLLHHGCVLIDTDLSVIGAVLRPKNGKAPAGAEKSSPGPVTTLSLAAGRTVTAAEFSAALQEELGGRGPARSPEDLCAAETLAALQKRYEDPAWTFGYPPSYEVTREERFPGGTVRVHLRIADGAIADAAFSGDFFCTGDIEALSLLLRGKRIDTELLPLLQRSPQALIIIGVTPSDLYRLIAG